MAVLNTNVFLRGDEEVKVIHTRDGEPNGIAIDDPGYAGGLTIFLHGSATDNVTMIDRIVDVLQVVRETMLDNAVADGASDI